MMTKIISYFIDQRKQANNEGNIELVLELDRIIKSMSYIYIDEWIDDE